MSSEAERFCVAWIDTAGGYIAGRLVLLTAVYPWCLLVEDDSTRVALPGSRRAVIRSQADTAWRSACEGEAHEISGTR
jgi:hypothetical protein